MVGCGEDEAGCGGAVGEGGLQGGGYGEGGGDARNDFEGDVVLAEEGHLFAGAAKDEGVAGFEAKDRLILTGVFEHERVDARLGDAGLAAAFADGDNVCGSVGEGEDFVGDEVVGEDDVCGFEETEGAEGEEGGVAGARSCEVDVAGLGGCVSHPSQRARRMWHPSGGGGSGGLRVGFRRQGYGVFAGERKAVRFANTHLSKPKYGAPNAVPGWASLIARKLFGWHWIFEGVFAGEEAGGALVEAADFAGGELVEEEFAFFVEGLGLGDFAAEVAEVGEPVAGVEGELGVDLFAEALGKSGRGSGGGDGDLKVAAADDGGEVEVAVGWVVDGVAEDVAGLGFEVDGAVDGGDVGGSDDEEVGGLWGGDIAGGIGAGEIGDVSGGGHFEDARAGVGRDDGDVGVGGAEGLDFGFGEIAGTDDEAAAGGEFEEDGEEVHG